MKKKDQIFLEEAYQKIFKEYSENSDPTAPDLENRAQTQAFRKEQGEQTARMQNWAIKKWTLTDPKAIAFIQQDIEKAAPAARIYPTNLKPGDKKSQEFILNLAKKELSNQPDKLKLVDPDKIIQSYNDKLQPGIEKTASEREQKQQVQNIQQRSSSNVNMSSTIKRLEQVGFQRGKPYKDATGVTITPMTKTIGSLLGGRQNTTVTVNPDGTIFKGQDVESWLTGSGKHFAKGKKSLF